MEKEQLHNLVKHLATLPRETECVEWKHNKMIPQEVGDNISGLSNAAALFGKRRAYILWGVEDSSHQILGTMFYPKAAKVGNQELESWLILQLDPQVDLRIHEVEVDGKHVVLFEIFPASTRPVRFKGTEFIRIGSYTKKLQDCPEKERELWRIFERASFEKDIAKGNVSGEHVLSLIDYPTYFQLMQLSLPENRSAILQKLVSEKIIRHSDNGNYEITNCGAVLFARNLEDFEALSRKVLRIIFYRGDNRVETIKEYRVCKGYALGFKEAVDYINDQLPQNEQIGHVFRKETHMYPAIAIRELVANALIHQDFTVVGAGPMVEIFANRIEISNPGIPLITPLRFIDEPPCSRNEMLAGFMRRLSLCEERGSGIDKVIFYIEEYRLPAPDFQVKSFSVISILYGPKSIVEMDPEERVRACYYHACLRYLTAKKMSNGSLRERLGIKKSSYTTVSKIIKDAIAGKLIKPHGDEVNAGKGAAYVPFWA